MKWGDFEDRIVAIDLSPKENFYVLRDGYNVTDALSQVEISKNESKAGDIKSPGLPYKLRQRMKDEEIEKRGFWNFIKLCVGVGIWLLACLLWGLKYGG